MASATHDSARLIAPPLPAVQRYFEVSLFLLVSTGLLSIVSTGKLDLLSSILVPAALVYKFTRLLRGRGPEISTRVATGLVLAYFLFFPIDLWVVSRDLAAGAPNPALYSALLAAIHLLIFAALIRLYSARSNRDFAFLAGLAVTSMLGSAILTVETGFLVALAIFLVLAVSTFVALEIRRSAADAVSPPFEAGSPLARQLNRALSLTSFIVAFFALCIGALIFFMIPRFTMGYLSALNLQPGLMTGFSDNVALGEIGEIQKNSAVVMRIKVSGDPTRAAEMHWRGIVFTNFDGKRWFTPEHEQTVLTPDSTGVYWLGPPILPLNDPNRLDYTVLMEPIASDAIFVAPRPHSITGRFMNETERALATTHRGYLFIDSTGSLSNPFHNVTKVRYEGSSLLPKFSPGALRSATQEFPPSVISTYLQLPSLDPRIARLAASAIAGSKTEYDKAANVERFLKARYTYSLDLSGDPGPDPLAYFLFTKRAGHCEYFAAAMTVMLRSQGIPARYVGGFLGGEFNDVGGDFIVRESDAHTWVEVYFPGFGWIPFDPTPPGDERRSGLFSRLGMYWDWFQFAWSEWIVNYDFSHQFTLAENMQKSSRDWGERARAYYHEKRRQTMDFLLAADRKLESSRLFLPSLVLFLLALLFILRGRTMINYVFTRWSIRARQRGHATASLATLEYREMLRLLERRGWKKSPSQTPLEFAAAIPSTEIAAPVAHLTELYQSARFGDHAVRMDEMSRLVRSIRDSLRQRKRPPGTRPAPPSAMALIAILALPLVAPASLRAQDFPKDYIKDNSDWRSILNENFRGPTLKAEPRSFAPANFEITGLRFHEAVRFSFDDPLADVQAKLGPARAAERGDAATARTQICYKSQELPDTFLIFELGEIDLSFYIFESGAEWNGMDRCVGSPLVTPGLATASGLRLGITPAQLVAILGSPTFENPSRIVYAGGSRRKTPAETLRALRRQNATMTESEFQENFAEFDSSVYIEARFAGRKLVYLAVSGSDTY
jgi:transglutaminase-like putative cysteine protease